MNRFSAFAAPLLLLCPSWAAPCGAQASALQTGDRVRLGAPQLQGMKGDAVVRRQTAEELTLALPDRTTVLAVPWSAITDLSVRQARPRSQGAIRGAKWGLGIGTALGIVVVVGDMLCKPIDCGEPAADELSTGALVAATVVESIGLGALIGALLPGHRWRAVDVTGARQIAAARSDSGGSAPLINDSSPTATAVRVPRDGSTPRVETTLGAIPPRFASAQFPGLTWALAVTQAIGSNRGGAALVADIDVSYLNSGWTAGPRFYRRSAPLFADRMVLTYFGQLLAGRVTPTQEGVMRTNGGFATQPGVGLDIGGASRAFRFQVDYRSVPGGVVEDSRQTPQQVDKLSGPRIVIGYTWRFGR